MRIPLSWLAEFVTWSRPAAALAERLTMAGVKIEAIEEVGRLDPRIVAGRLAAVEPHPDADRLRVCRVDVGGPAPIVAVSGAPGLAAGQLVPMAPPGASFPDGREAQAVRIRGVESAGVLCSEAELALGEDASQVLVLADDTAPGTPLAALPGIADTVLEAEVTPNRGDCLSVLGVAREVAAVSGARLRHPRPRPRESGAAAAREVRVRVDAADLCPRYCARVVRGVGIVPAPLWMRLRLRRAGMRALNAIVDATNYVMLERRVDPAMVPEALDAVAALIARTAGGRVAPGIVEDAPGTKALAPPTIRLRPRRVIALLGARLARGEIARSLHALGATYRTQRDALVVTPPSFRGDLRLEEDLIEEVARVGGYDRIPVALPEVPLAAGEDTPERRLAARVRRALVAAGLAEMVTIAFTNAETNRRLPGFVGRALAPLAVKNPLSSETGELRRSPLAALVRALRLNLALGATFVGAFELGKGYGLDAHGARQEPRAVALLLAGAWPPCGVERTGPPVDFLDLKGVLGGLFAALGLDGERVRWRPAGEIDALHPGKAALVELGGATLGVAGALHPAITQSADLPGEVWVAELDFAELAHYVPRRLALRPLPRFPAVTRDLAVVVDEAFRAGDILEEIRALQNPHIELVRLFDCYRGAPVPAGKKSLAYTIAYRAPDRTLTDEEVNGLHAAVLQRLAGRFALEFRA